MPSRKAAVSEPGTSRADGWVRFELLIPGDWYRWLREAADARKMSMADLVRQFIRNAIVTRHEQ